MFLATPYSNIPMLHKIQVVGYTLNYVDFTIFESVGTIRNVPSEQAVQFIVTYIWTCQSDRSRGKKTSRDHESGLE